MAEESNIEELIQEELRRNIPRNLSEKDIELLKKKVETIRDLNQSI